MSFPPELKQRCIDAMNNLMSHPIAAIFAKPVNPEEDGIQNYYEIVKHPTDLSKIRDNLINDKYSNVQSWINEMRYIWSNAEKINAKGGVVLTLAAELKKHFKKELKQVKSYKLRKWTKLAASLKDKLDDLLDQPPDALSNYAIITEQVSDSEPNDFDDIDLGNLISATTFLTGNQDVKRISAIIKRHNPEAAPTNNNNCVDIHALSASALSELKEYAEKRLVEMKIPYPHDAIRLD